LLFVFVFNTLLVAARRQAYKAFSKEAAAEKSISPAPTEGRDGKVDIVPGASPGFQAVPGMTGGFD
jgi:hypothetical protein